MNYVTIVDAHGRDLLGRGYIGMVMLGTINSYNPSPVRSFRRWTAAGAKRAGDRWIRHSMRRAERDWRRRQKARAATGYETELQA